jgi:hypothetical protein
MTAADMWIEMGEADEPSGVRAKRLPRECPVTLETTLLAPSETPHETVERVCRRLGVSAADVVGKLQERPVRYVVKLKYCSRFDAAPIV